MTEQELRSRNLLGATGDSVFQGGDPTDPQKPKPSPEVSPQDFDSRVKAEYHPGTGKWLTYGATDVNQSSQEVTDFKEGDIIKFNREFTDLGDGKREYKPVKIKTGRGSVMMHSGYADLRRDPQTGRLDWYEVERPLEQTLPTAIVKSYDGKEPDFSGWEEAIQNTKRKAHFTVGVTRTAKEMENSVDYQYMLDKEAENRGIMNHFAKEFIKSGEFKNYIRFTPSEKKKPEEDTAYQYGAIDAEKLMDFSLDLARKYKGDRGVATAIYHELRDQIGVAQMQPRVDREASNYLKKAIGMTREEILSKDQELQKQVGALELERNQVIKGLNAEAARSSAIVKEKADRLFDEKYKPWLHQIETLLVAAPERQKAEYQKLLTAFTQEVRQFNIKEMSRIERLKQERLRSLVLKAKELEKLQLTPEQQKALEKAYSYAYDKVTRDQQEADAAVQDALTGVFGQGWLMGKSFVNGLAQSIANKGNALLAFNIDNKFSDWLRGFQTVADETRVVTPELKGVNWLNPSAYTTRIGNQLGNQAIGIAASVATMNPVAGGLIGFVDDQLTTGGEVYRQARERGEDHIVASRKAYEYMNKNAMLLPFYFVEALGFKVAAKGLKGFALGSGLQVATEVPQEVAQTHFQNQADDTYTKTLGEFARSKEGRDVALEAVIGAIGTDGAISTFSEMTSSLARKSAHVSEQQTAQIILNKGINAARALVELDYQNGLIDEAGLKVGKEAIARIANTLSSLKAVGMDAAAQSYFVGKSKALADLSAQLEQTVDPAARKILEEKIKREEKELSDLSQGKLEFATVTYPTGNSYSVSLPQMRELLQDEGFRKGLKEQAVGINVRGESSEAKSLQDAVATIAKATSQFQVGITPATPYVEHIGAKLKEAQALQQQGDHEGAKVVFKEILNEGRGQIDSLFADMPDVRINVDDAMSVFFDEAEPSFRITIDADRKHLPEIQKRFATLSELWQQRAVHVSELIPVTEEHALGVEREDGSIDEANLEIEFEQPLGDQELADINALVQAKGLAGSTAINNKTLILYNVSKFKNNEQFIQESIDFIRELNNRRGVPAKAQFGARRLWNIGNPEDGATRTYEQVRNPDVPAAIEPAADGNPQGGRVTPTAASEKLRSAAKLAGVKSYTVANIESLDADAEGLTDTQRKVLNDAKRVLPSINNIARIVSGKDAELRVYDDEDAYGEAVVQAGGSRQDAATKGFWLSSDGTIHLNMNRVSTGTMLHEGFHPVLDFVEAHDPERIDSLYEELSSLKGAEGVIGETLQNYQGDTTIKKEAITAFVEGVADGSIKINASNFERIKNFFKSLLNKLGFDFAVDTLVDMSSASELKNLAEMMARKFKTGEEITENELVPGGKEEQESEEEPFQPLEVPDEEPGSVAGAGKIDKDRIDEARVTPTNPVFQFSRGAAASLASEGLNIRPEFMPEEVVDLQTRTLMDVYEEYDGLAVAVNSDPTRVGELTLPTGETIFLYGGPKYTALKKNVDAQIGFASSQMGKVKQLNTAATNTFKKHGGKGPVFVMTQNPLSQFGNAYSLEYVLSAIRTLPKKVLRSTDFKNEFFGKDIKAIKEAFGEDKYNEFLRKYGKADLGSNEMAQAMMEDLLKNVGSNFVARNALVSNMLAGVKPKSDFVATKDQPGYTSVAKPSKYIAKALLGELGLNQEKLLYEIGEKWLIDEFMNNGRWGFILHGFIHDANVDYNAIQDKGIIHPQFNAKFHGTDAFKLDGAYHVDKLWLPQDMIAKSGKPFTKYASQMLSQSMYQKGQIERSIPEASSVPQFSRSSDESLNSTIQDAQVLLTQMPEAQVVTELMAKHGISEAVARNIVEHAKRAKVYRPIRPESNRSTNGTSGNLEEGEEVSDENALPSSNALPYEGVATTAGALATTEQPQRVNLDDLARQHYDEQVFEKTWYRDAADQVRVWRKRFFSAHKGMPEWFTALRDKVRGESQLRMRQAMQTVNKVKEVAKQIGFEDWDRFDIVLRSLKQPQASKFTPLSAETDIALFDPYRASEAAPHTIPDDQLPMSLRESQLNLLPEELRPLAVEMRNQIDGLSRELITKGLVSPEQAAVIESNLGEYMHRSYEAYNRKDWAKQIRPEVRQEAFTYLFKEEYRKIANASIDMNPGEIALQATDNANRRLKEIIDGVDDQYKAEKFRMHKGKDMTSLEMRQDIPTPIRRLLGEYTDPTLNFMITIAKLSTLKNQARFLQSVRDLGMGTLFYEEHDPARPADYSVPAAAEGSETWSPLNGLMTTPEIKKLLHETEPQRNALVKAWLTTIGIVRWGKTVGSPITQARNLISNVGFAVLNGHYHLTEMGKGGRYAWDKLFQGGKLNDEDVNEAISEGLLDQSVTAGELKSALRENEAMEFVAASTVAKRNIWQKSKEVVAAPFSFANRMYRTSDDLWKVYAYLNERMEVASAWHGKKYEELTGEQKLQVRSEAAERVRNTYPTYDRVWEGASFLSKNMPIFGNFISFQAESIRVMLNSFRYAIRDLKDPKTKMMGVRRLAGIGLYLSARSILIKTLASATGLGVSGLLGLFNDDEEEEKLRDVNRYAAPWQRNGEKVIRMVEPGVYDVYDLATLDPYGIWFRTINTIDSGNENNPNGGVKAAIWTVLSPFVENEMVFESMLQLYTNKDGYGKPILSPHKSDGEQLTEALNYVWKRNRPSIVDLMGRVEKNGVQKEALGAIGAKPIQMDVGMGFAIKLREAEERFNSIFFEYYKGIKNSTSEEERTEVTRRANGYIRKEITKLHEDYTAALRLGVPAEKLEEILKKKQFYQGYTKQVKLGIVTGDIADIYTGKMGGGNIRVGKKLVSR